MYTLLSTLILKIANRKHLYVNLSDMLGLCKVNEMWLNFNSSIVKQFLWFLFCANINPCDEKYNRPNAVLRDGNSFLIDKSKKSLNKSLKIVLSAIYTNYECI